MSSITEAFSKSLNQYLNFTEMPWGKLFYSTSWNQIEDYLQERNQTILDIGCGFGITSLEFARRGNKVKGIDPTYAMIEVAMTQKGEEKLDLDFVVTDFQKVAGLLGKFNWIFCHNILEYVEEPGKFIESISMCQDPGGYLSLIAHNPPAKVMKKAVINKNPEDALNSLGNQLEYSGVIQTDITVYTFEQLQEMLEKSGYEIQERYGIHNIYGYIADNEVKQDTEWHKKVSKLEMELGKISPYKDIAIFTHIIAKKKA